MRNVKWYCVRMIVICDMVMLVMFLFFWVYVLWWSLFREVVEKYWSFEVVELCFIDVVVWMLNLNYFVISGGIVDEEVYKVLIYDNFCCDILFLLICVNDL